MGYSSEEDILQTLKVKDLSKYGEPANNSPLLSALWTLEIVKDNTETPYITVKTISYLLLELKEIKMREDSISKALNRAGNKVQSHKDGDKVYYRILKLGRDYLMPIKKVSKKTIRERIYERNSSYDFYTDVCSIISNCKRELFLIDSYLTRESFDLYVKEITKKNIKIRLLINEPKQNNQNRMSEINVLTSVVKKLGDQSKNIELKESKLVHDRAIFIDDSAFVFGQSLEDGGNKPTYLIEVDNWRALKDIFEQIWNDTNSTSLI